MKKHTSETVIVAALYPINHNRKKYLAGQLLEVDVKQVKFLKIAKSVRDATPSELEDYAKPKAVPAQVEHAAPIDSQNVGPATVAANMVDETATDSDSVGVTSDEDAFHTDSVDAPEAAVSSPYDGWLKADLNAELDERGIEHDAYARNDVLEKLLLDDDMREPNEGDADA